MHVTMKLLENAMQAILIERTTGDGWNDDCGRFLVDGFPRKMDQAIGFDEQVGIIAICVGFLLNSAIGLPIIACHLL